MTKSAILLFLSALTAFPRTDRALCGTHRDGAQEELALHRASMRTGVFKSRSAGGRAAVRDFGDITVIDDSEGVIARRNLFNLPRRQVTFAPGGVNASVYRFAAADAVWDETAANDGEPLEGLADDDSREVAIGFSFPFFGRTHTRLFVNSDGNLTFEEKDDSTADRSLGRVISGSPRVAGLFEDLDPSRTPGGVRVFRRAGELVVSWVGVPEYSDFGRGPVNTFQVRLHEDGRVAIIYQAVATRSGVVGISPGGIAPGTAVVAFNSATSGEYRAAVVERFSAAEEIDSVFASQKFFETHDDNYDYLAVYNNQGIGSGAGLANEFTVRSVAKGIGDTVTDIGAQYGSARRMKAILNMGPLSQFPEDLNAPAPGRAGTGDTALTLMAHEVGHLWLAFTSVREGTFRPMLGYQAAHWAFTFNSEASLLEGNRIRDDGEGALPRFHTVATVQGYSALDQYLMGLRAPDEVPPSFYVSNPSIGTAFRTPSVGVAFNGARRDVHVDELIAVHGRRVPDHTVAQRRFRLGTILVTAAGADPSPAELAKLERMRVALAEFFERATEGRATLDTTLRRAARLSLAPHGGLIAGRTATASVNLTRPAESALTVTLRATGPAAIVPASVTVPAGQTRATFEIRGASAGVTELTATPGDARYAVEQARIAVRASTAGLRVEVLSGDQQRAQATALTKPVVFRVIDENETPYAGLTLNVAASSGGQVGSATVVTNDEGTASVAWTPGPGPLYELRATLAGTTISGAAGLSGAKPVIGNNGVVNAASFTPGLTPGGLATVFGAQFGTAGARVLINGESARVLAAFDRQINFVAPANLTGAASLTVESPDGLSAPVTVTVRDADPGVFFDAASGLAAAFVRTGYVEIYATGLGAVRDSSAFPGLRETARAPVVNIGGVDTEVLFSGLAPGFEGLYQINARIPPGVTGTRELRVRVDQAQSNVTRITLP